MRTDLHKFEVVKILQEELLPIAQYSGLNELMDDIINDVKSAKIPEATMHLDLKNIAEVSDIISSVVGAVGMGPLLSLRTKLKKFEKMSDVFLSDAREQLRLPLKGKNNRVLPLLLATVRGEKALTQLNTMNVKVDDDETIIFKNREIIKYIMANHRFDVDLKFVSNLLTIKG